MPHILCLFDIDGTLVDTGGAGMAALRETAFLLYGDHGPELDLAGATDLGIIEGILDSFGMQSSPSEINRYLAIYHELLERNLVHGNFGGKILDGVVTLLGQLRDIADVHLGLLTGNTETGASIKLRHYGLDHHFAFGAFGCDAADRNLLGHLALARAKKATGIAFDPTCTWVIGDTPKDVACAKAVGAKCLAVATGRFSEEELHFCSANLTVPSLENLGKWWM